MPGTTCDPAEIRLSTHSVDNFQRRIRPALDWQAAKRELKRLLSCGAVSAEAPGWLARTAMQEAERYLTIGADLVLPLVYDGATDAWIAKTCIGRGGISTPARQRRNQKARARRQRRTRR